MKLNTATFMAAIGAMAQVLSMVISIVNSQLIAFNVIEYRSTAFSLLRWGSNALALGGGVLVCVFFFVLLGKQK